MRGDSLRDFYAKALALAGLGALASIGALVDYWPAAVDVPRVTGTGIIDRVPAPAIARRAELLPVLNVPEARRHVRPRAAATPVAVLESAPAVEPELIAEVAIPEALLAAGPDRFDVTPVDESDLPSSEIRLSLPARPSVDLEDHRSAIVAPPATTVLAAASTSSDGITGVFRKTGSSIAMVGMKTGSTIVGAFRAVGGAFRKIL